LESKNKTQKKQNKKQSKKTKNKMQSKNEEQLASKVWFKRQTSLRVKLVKIAKIHLLQ